MADQAIPLSETQILRQAWTSSAQQVIQKLAAEKPVPPGEVQALQAALENIEQRELFEQARELTLATGS